MYQIIIKKSEIRETPSGKDWKVIGEDFITTEDMKDRNYYKQEEIDKIYKSGKIPKLDKSGYTPEIMKKELVEETIYDQRIEKLDLPAVIKAVNGL